MDAASQQLCRVFMRRFYVEVLRFGADRSIE